MVWFADAVCQELDEFGQRLEWQDRLSSAVSWAQLIRAVQGSTSLSVLRGSEIQAKFSVILGSSCSVFPQCKNQAEHVKLEKLDFLAASCGSWYNWQCRMCGQTAPMAGCWCISRAAPGSLGTWHTLKTSWFVVEDWLGIHFSLRFSHSQCSWRDIICIFNKAALQHNCSG